MIETSDLMSKTSLLLDKLVDSMYKNVHVIARVNFIRNYNKDEEYINQIVQELGKPKEEIREICYKDLSIINNIIRKEVMSLSVIYDIHSAQFNDKALIAIKDIINRRFEDDIFLSKSIQCFYRYLR